MSKKRAKVTKSAQIPAPVQSGPKQLAITPQIAVGLGPDLELFVEAPNKSGSRHKVKLTPESAYSYLLSVLTEKAAEIEAERQTIAAAKAKARRRTAQPDWRLIAKHPEAEIRGGLTEAALCAKGSITVLPTRASQLTSLTATNTLEEMGL